MIAAKILMMPKKILIVDDDQFIANTYSNKLRIEGFETESVGDGESAVEILGQTPPDLVILDLMLPGMNGVEVLKRIRARPETATLPVIILSNNYLTSIVQEAWKAGATKYIAKSHSTPRQMAEIVSKLLADEPLPTAESPAAEPGTAADPTLAIQAGGEPVAKSDVAFQIKLVESFLANAPKTLAAMRSRHQAFARSENPKAQLEELDELKQQARHLADSAGLVGYHTIGQIASALEALLKELHSRPDNITASTIRTIAQAVDALAALVGRAGKPQAEAPNSHLILVVEHERNVREKIFAALKEAGLRGLGLDKSSLAMPVLEQNAFDLIFLDMEMPEISGSEVCNQIRKTDTNRATPVVFVAPNADLENRARSAKSGGNDLIAKPFLPLELALKALTWLSKNKGSV